MVDLRFLPHLIDLEDDPVGDTPALDNGLAVGAIEGKGHGDDGLEGISLGAPGRADVGLAGGDPDSKVQDVGHRFGRNPWSIIGNGDLALDNIDDDRGRGVGLLGGI